MLQSGEIFKHIGISLMRVVVGFVAGTVLAVIVGVTIVRLKTVNELPDPIIEFYGISHRSR
jgi:NitT/TauT family transport system permease protein